MKISITVYFATPEQRAEWHRQLDELIAEMMPTISYSIEELNSQGAFAGRIIYKPGTRYKVITTCSKDGTTHLEFISNETGEITNAVYTVNDFTCLDYQIKIFD